MCHYAASHIFLQISVSPLLPFEKHLLFRPKNVPGPPQLGAEGGLSIDYYFIGGSACINVGMTHDTEIHLRSEHCSIPE